MPLAEHGQGLVSAHGSHNGKRRHGELPKTLAQWVGGPARAGGGGKPLPERAVLKQGALTPHHRAPSTAAAAAAIIVTLGGVAR